MLKGSILFASAGGFLFTLILAKYWPAKEYGNFVSEFSLISYISFPFLYGLIPHVLRQLLVERAGDFVTVIKKYGTFTFAYLVVTCLFLTLSSNSTFSLIVMACVWLLVLAAGFGEALLRAKAIVNPIFLSRALGMLASICILLVIVFLDWEQQAWYALFIRMLPSTLAVAAACFIAVNITIKNAATTSISEGKSEANLVGVIGATLVPLTIGLFQYIFIVVGSNIIDPKEFVNLSINLMVSVTVCQKLIEPHVFRLYEDSKLMDMVSKDQRATRFFILLELFAFSFCAQIVADIILHSEIKLSYIMLFSLGASVASFAHLIHFAIYVHGRAIAFSLTQLVFFGTALGVVSIIHNRDIFLISFVLMAGLYFYFANRRMQLVISKGRGPNFYGPDQCGR